MGSTEKSRKMINVRDCGWQYCSPFRMLCVPVVVVGVGGGNGVSMSGRGGGAG